MPSRAMSPRLTCGTWPILAKTASGQLHLGFFPLGACCVDGAEVARHALAMSALRVAETLGSGTVSYVRSHMTPGSEPRLKPKFETRGL